MAIWLKSRVFPHRCDWLVSVVMLSIINTSDVITTFSDFEMR